MRKTIIALFCVLLLVPLVTAHSIETKYVIRSDDQYNVKFSSDPEFPVINRETHMNFEVWDNAGEPVAGANMKIELVKDDRRTTLPLTEKDDHYDVEHVFDEQGIYRIIPYINDQKLEIEFNIEVDAFGLSGILRSGLIFLFLITLIIKMYKDCKKPKGG